VDKTIIVITILSFILVFGFLSQLSTDLKIILPAGGVAIGIIIGIMKFYLQQKSRHNLEFSKLLTAFEDKWTNARTDWKNNKERYDYDICYGMCSKRLAVLDSLAFLTDKGKIDNTMLEYFKIHSSEGLLYLKWIGDIEPSETKAWPSFSKYTDNLKPKPKAASVNLLPSEFHLIYSWRTTNDFTDDPKSIDKN